MVWAGLRPGIKARIKPFAREDGRFTSINELFKKAQDVEIRSNRDKRAGTTQNLTATTAEKKHGNNVGNNSVNNSDYNGGDNGSKDKKKRPYHDTQSPTPSRNHSRHYSHNYSHLNLPRAPLADRETRDNRREQGLCLRCGRGHKTFLCRKYPQADVPPTRKY
jgi:hypothetical protein